MVKEYTFAKKITSIILIAIFSSVILAWVIAGPGLEIFSQFFANRFIELGQSIQLPTS